MTPSRKSLSVLGGSLAKSVSDVHRSDSRAGIERCAVLSRVPQKTLFAALALGAQAAQGQPASGGHSNIPEREAAATARPSILHVHGGFVDGSGWDRVYKILKKDGYKVTIVQNPTTSLNDDVAVTRRAIDEANGPVILVGHSYGGVVITEAGNDPRVSGLVYIAAFAPDNGESVAKLIANPAPGAPVPPILPPVEGFLMLDKAKFAASFAADVEPSLADFHGPFASRVGR